MKRHRKVVWQEGMFIAPQHFQQQERYFSHYVERYVSAIAAAGGYGLTALETDAERLKIGQFSLLHCQGVFADGSYFESDRELLLEIPDGTLEKKIYLALPLVVEGEAQSGALRQKRRYFVESSRLYDSSDEASTSIDADLAQSNIRLLLEGEDMAGLTTIAIAKVLEKRESGKVVLDQSFVPSVLHYGASHVLSDRLKEVQVLVQARAQAVVSRIDGGRERKSDQTLMHEYLWLQTLNRWTPWLSLTLQQPDTHIDEVHRQLLTLNAELSAFAPSVASACDTLNPRDIAGSMLPLFAQLREQLSLVQSDRVREFSWDDNLFEKRRLLRTAIGDIHTLENHRFVLSVESSIGAANLMRLFPSACKLCGLSQIAEVVRNGLSGVTLSALPVAPSELKPRNDLCYIEIDTHHKYWQELLEKREPIVAHIDARIPDLELKLFALG
ncbi:MAG: type VI secretion system baseplate subunit TssK [Pseudomonadales bacterium]